MDIAEIFNPSVALFSFINFLAVLFVLKVFLFDRIKKVIDDRQQLIDQSLKDADRIREEMENADRQYQQIIAKANKQASEILSENRRKAEELMAQMKAEAEESIRKEQLQALKKLQAEHEEMLQQLKTEAAELAVQGAKAILEKEVDEDQDRALVENYLKDLKPVNAS